jgi:hypothetical protein
MNKKMRTNVICFRCRHHTYQKRVVIKGKIKWYCCECGMIQPKKKGVNYD